MKTLILNNGFACKAENNAERDQWFFSVFADYLPERSELIFFERPASILDYLKSHGGEEFAFGRQILLPLEFQVKDNPIYDGLSLAVDIRLAGVLVPILICSSQNKASLLQRAVDPEKLKLDKDLLSNHEDVLKYNLLRIPGHYFLQIQDDVQVRGDFTWPIAPMTVSLWKDTLFYFLNPHGNVHEVFHSMKNEIRPHLRDAVQIERIVHEGFGTIRKYFEDEVRLAAIERRYFAEALAANTVQELARKNPEYEGEIIGLLPSNYRPEARDLSVKEWGVLFLDDEQEAIDKVGGIFQRFGIPCFTARTGAEAISLLEKDRDGRLEDAAGHVLPANFLTVLISDWRLWNAEKTELQEMQGMDVLQYVFEKLDNYLSLFMLTSKNGAVIEELAREVEMQVYWSLKDDLHEYGVSKFVNQVYREGEKVYRTLVELKVKSEYWGSVFVGHNDYPHSVLYRQHRISSDYVSAEKTISEMALEYVEEAMMHKKFRDEDAQYRGSMDDAFPRAFAANILAVNANGKGIRIPRTQDKVNKGSRAKKKETKVPDPQRNWKAIQGLGATITDKVLAKFRHRLLGRRIALALSGLGWNGAGIMSILQHGIVNDDEPDAGMLPNYFMNVYLCLAAAQPRGHREIDPTTGLMVTSKNTLNRTDILVEEVNWLKKFEASLRATGNSAFHWMIRNQLKAIQDQFSSLIPKAAKEVINDSGSLAKGELEACLVRVSEVENSDLDAVLLERSIAWVGHALTMVESGAFELVP